MAEGTDRSKAVATSASRYKHMADMEKLKPVESLTPLRLMEDQKYARSALKTAMSKKARDHTTFWTTRLQAITAELKRRGY